jgi:hypothetical protein
VRTQSLEYGAEALRQVFDAYALIAKNAIDHDPRDTATLGSINGYLDEFLRHWDPEYNSPQQWEIDLLAQRPDIDRRQLAEMGRQAADSKERLRTKEELDTWRAVQRFGLLWWTQRRLRDTGDVAYVEAWNAFVGYFGNVTETARVVDRAVQADFENRGRWMTWVPLDPVHGGAFSGPAIDLEFLQTFVVVALNHVSPDGPPPPIEPLEWLTGRLIEAEETTYSVIANETLRPLLPEDHLEDRASHLVEGFRAMIRARDELEDQHVIDAPLDEAAVADFKQRLRDEWASHRLVVPALQHFGMYQVVESESEQSVRPLRSSLRWMPKNWLISDPRVAGIDRYAAELGRELAESEVKYLAEAAAVASEFVVEDGVSIARALRAAIDAVRTHAEQLVVYAPIDWRLVNALELSLSERRGGPATPPRWLPEALHDYFIGEADGVPVIHSRELSDDRILIVALDAFAQWRQWRPPGEHEVSVTITAFDDETARRRVEENAELFHDDEHTSDEARAREVRKNLVLDVHEHMAIDVLNSEAALWMNLPPAFRG